MEKTGTGVVNGGAAPEHPAGTVSRATFAFIIVTVTLDFLAFGIIAPVLPNLIIRFEGGNMAKAAAITGYFGFAWNLMQFLFLPVLGAAFGVGFVVGPAVGGLLGQYNLRAPFWAAAVLSLANFLYGLFVLPESLPKENRAKSAWHMANPLGSLTLLRSHPVLAGLSVVVFLYYLAQQALQNVFVLYTEYRYGWNTRSVGISLALVGVCAVIVSGGMVGPYVKKFGERLSLTSGLFFGVLGYVGFAMAPKGWLLLAAVPFIALW